jgi:hypothetical protein
LSILGILVLANAIAQVGVRILDVSAAYQAERSHAEEVIKVCNDEVQRSLVAEMASMQNYQTGEDKILTELKKNLLKATKKIKENERLQVVNYKTRNFFVFTKYAYMSVTASLLILAHSIHQFADPDQYGDKVR